ncbi:MAG TPA: DUF6544 family protein [Gammaproteobacteria bacterium]|nr:DUF6544 family protein [Gammaproteobacteria bacterium]
MSPGRRRLERLWGSASASGARFGAEQLTWQPADVRRYLEHSIAHGTALATAVRLRMHGEIRLGRWRPFTAEQVICSGHGMVWCAGTRVAGVAVGGCDELLAGEGAMCWRLLGLLPVVRRSGPDITRSAAGRMQAEHVWLPSALCARKVVWSARPPGRIRAVFPVLGHPGALELEVGPDGRLKRLQMQRWGAPAGSAYAYLEFGAVAEEERTFSGYTIPSRLRVGWNVGSERFEHEGEFLRATVDSAAFR